jgi:hypothetical protein
MMLQEFVMMTLAGIVIFIDSGGHPGAIEQPAYRSWSQIRTM